MSFSILGTGSSLASTIKTNDDLAKTMDTSDEWIQSKTGIKERRLLGDENLADLVCESSLKALEMANIKPEELDLIICATVTSDYVSPSLSCVIQKRIKAKCPAFDINAGCSGFVYALDIAESYFTRNPDSKILVIGADAVSRITNWKDRNTAVLFGDAAGACVLGKGNGLKSITTHAKGNTEYLYVPNNDNDRYIRMEGQKVFQFAVSAMARDMDKVLEEAGLTYDDIDYVLPHQANMRIIDFAIQRTGMEKEKFFINIDRTGNTSAGTVPVLLDENVRNGKITKGDKLVLAAFGAGLTSAAAVLEWTI